MKSKLFAIAFAFFLSVSAMAQAKVLVAAADPYPPFLDNDNPKQGISMELIRAAFATQGYTVKWENVPWARAEAGVKDGIYDFLPDTWMTEARKAYLAYSDPYAVNEVVFIKKKGDSFEFNGLDSLKGKTVGIVKDYGYGDVFMKSALFTREEAVDIITNIRKLTLGRVDLTLEDGIVARATIMKLDPGLLSQIEFTKGSLSSNNLYIAPGLKNPRYQEIIAAFNKGLKAIKADGSYQKILAGYGFK
jgi:polar amino acid transport system substrate-binding protein